MVARSQNIPETPLFSHEKQTVGGKIFGSISAGLFAAGFCVLAARYCTGLTLWWTLLCAGLAAALRLLSLKKQFQKTAPLLPLGAALLVAVCGFSSCWNSLLTAINNGIAQWNAVYADAVAYLPCANTAGVFFSIFLVLVTAAGSAFLVQWNKPMLSILLLFVLTLPALVLHDFSDVGMGLCLTGWLLQKICRCERTFSWKKAGWFTVAAAVLLSVAAFSGEQNIRSVDTLRKDLKTTISRIRYGEDTMPHGDLSKAGTMQQGTDVRLSVQQSKPETLYLRGFVGANYTGGKWSTFSRAAFRGENQGILDWLSGEGFSPALQYAEYRKADAGADAENQVTVQNVGADRQYVYLPYNAETVDGKASLWRDTGMKASGLFGAKNYSFSEVEQRSPGELLYPSDWVVQPESSQQKSYANCESVYRSFVYQQYLEIPEELQPLLEKQFPQEDLSEHTVYAATQQIHTVLEECSHYSEDAAELTAGEEPMEAFLHGGTGNSAWYATAAVLAYRSYGFPARYAEGYYLDGSEADVQVTAGDAHAWAEVYIDGLGWVPIDVTPGFYYDVYTLMEMVQTPQNVEKTAVSDEETEDTDVMQRQGEQNLGREILQDSVRNTGVLLLGSAALLLIVLAGLLIVKEVRSTVLLHHTHKQYRNGDARQQQTIICEWIPYALREKGVEMHLGWQVEETEQKIRQELLPELPEGAFRRVNRLMEKCIYGEECLPPYEQRVLALFLEQLVSSEKTTLTGRKYFWFQKMLHIKKARNRKTFD